MAPATSIRCITLPPSRFPKGLASLGSTTSTISAADSATVFPGSLAMWCNLQNDESRRQAARWSTQRKSGQTQVLIRLQTGPLPFEVPEPDQDGDSCALAPNDTAPSTRKV